MVPFATETSATLSGKYADTAKGGAANIGGGGAGAGGGDNATGGGACGNTNFGASPVVPFGVEHAEHSAMLNIVMAHLITQITLRMTIPMFYVFALDREYSKDDELNKLKVV